MLGWDVGTFEFQSDQIIAENYKHSARIKTRTGGSVGKIGRHLCHSRHEGAGYYWDLSKIETKRDVRLPVKYRFRSPVVFEFHTGRGKPDAYAILWLQHLVDNETTEIDLPMWKTSAPARLTQNYITEESYRKDMPGLEDLEIVGRLKLKGRFKAGMDESHKSFIVDDDSRETYETWESCLSEGVRHHVVEKELPERLQTLHDQSLTEGRDMLKQADEEEKKKWLTREGTDWSGAFGEDPKAYLDTKGRKRREPGSEKPLHDPHAPSDDEDHDEGMDTDDSDNEDLGITDASNVALRSGRKSVDTTRTGTTVGTQDTNGTTGTEGSLYDSNEKDANGQNKRTEERKQRGIMQWKPARNMKFAKDESKLGLKRLKDKLTGGLDGRQPGVDTETGT